MSDCGVGRVILSDGTMLDIVIYRMEVQMPESRHLKVDGRRPFQSAFFEQIHAPRYLFECELLHAYKPVE